MSGAVSATGNTVKHRQFPGAQRNGPLPPAAGTVQLIPRRVPGDSSMRPIGRGRPQSRCSATRARTRRRAHHSMPATIGMVAAWAMGTDSAGQKRCTAFAA